ncbi:MAG TPA: NAD(P)/FAD-dependent oxidoreductase [Pyrinomonadaceae bacterium]|nr:NAD(P)/FAD-dependent oxidoreductase [Pyrinomonadaceae bacterium]
MTTMPDMFDVAIAGAGPAGSSAAIHLAKSGASVLLIEQKKFPRAKLCGEFISPECLRHFERLDVVDQMVSSGGVRLTRTVFYSHKGRNLNIPSEWFGDRSSALGLSRAEMDRLLLDRAKSCGVVVLEDAHATELIRDQTGVRGIRVKSGKTLREYTALACIDATGRTRALARKLKPHRSITKSRPRLIAFKAHLTGAQPEEGACEIYSYPGGYGGLDQVEGSVSNLCFIAAAKEVRRCGSDPDRVLRELVLQNQRAALTLARAQRSTEWLSVSIERFGRHELVPAPGLLMIGDAAAFIDPFTGSGILMALESGEVAAQTIISHLERLRSDSLFNEVARDYRRHYYDRFNSRLRVCGWIRRVAFVPWLAEAAILCFGASTRLRHRIASATRSARETEEAA